MHTNCEPFIMHHSICMPLLNILRLTNVVYYVIQATSNQIS